MKRIILAIIFVLINCSAVLAQKQDTLYRILLLSTDGFSYPYTQIYTANYEAEFKKQGIRTTFIYESLNLYMFSDEKDDYYQALVNSYKIKYKNCQPDLIMAVEFAAADFLMQYGNIIFNKTPVITTGTSELNSMIQKENWYQVLDTLDVRRMFRTIEILQPETKTVTVIIGSSYYEKDVVKWLKSKQKSMSFSIKTRFTTDKTYDEVKEMIKHPQKDETFYFFYFFEDSKGEKYIPKDVLFDLDRIAGCPIFVYTDYQVQGENIIGGSIQSIKQLGILSAQKSIEILNKNGDSPSNSHLQVSTVRDVFNWTALKKHNIPLKRLPENSIILNKKPTVWELYRHYIVIVIAVLIIQTILIVLLLKNRAKRRKAENKIIEINRNLEKMVEKQVAKIKNQNQILEKNMQQLVALQKHKEDLTTMLVHDLKNPLSTLINMPSSSSPKEKRAMKDYLANKMLLLVMNILDVQKFEEKKVILNRTDEKICSLIKTAIEHQKYNINAKDIDIQTNSKIDAVVNIDKELIERVFLNLLSNSVKYTPTGGKIEITITPKENNYIKIAISDNGTGIKQENLKHIFDKYNQSSERKRYSTGLGLTFCKMAIEAHNGEIDIQSNSNRGTTVWFMLQIKKLVDKNERISISETNQIPDLNRAEKQFLLPFYPVLKKMDMSEISVFRKVYKKIENSNIVNSEWLSALYKSVLNLNRNTYQNLINRIKDGAEI